MKTKTHDRLAAALFPLLPADATPLDRFLFRVGCCEPDPNIITWAIDSKPLIDLEGHSYPFCIRRALKSLKRTKHFRYFRVGVSMHYYADAFTYPHNPWFVRSWKRHMDYEDRLDAYVASVDTAPLLETFSDRTVTSPEAFLYALHAEYEKETPSLAVDAAYTFGAGAAILRYLVD